MRHHGLESILAEAEGILVPLDGYPDAATLDRPVRGLEFHQPGTETDYRAMLVLVSVPVGDKATLAAIYQECESAAAIIFPPKTPRNLGVGVAGGPALLRRSAWVTTDTLVRALTAITEELAADSGMGDPSDVLERDAAKVVLRRDSALLALLSGTADPAIPAAIAGLRPDRHHAVIAARVANGDVGWFEVALDSEFDEVWNVVSDGIFLAVLRCQGAEESSVVVERLRARLNRTSHGGIDLPIGVGPVVPGLTQIHESAKSARMLLRALNVKLGDLPLADSGEVRVAGASDVDDALAIVEATDALKPHSDSFAVRLRILEDYDREHRADLLPTVLAALKQQSNVAAAARPLGIHPNSFRARLERIREVAGIDLNDHASRLRTILAFVACPDVHNVALSGLPLDRPS